MENYRIGSVKNSNGDNQAVWGRYNWVMLLLFLSCCFSIVTKRLCIQEGTLWFLLTRWVESLRKWCLG